MRTLRNPSTEFFDYTCATLDQIMDQLEGTLLQYVSENEDSNVIKAIGRATEAIKYKVTYPGRAAFDDVVNTMYEQEKTIDTLTEQNEKLVERLDEANDDIQSLRNRLEEAQQDLQDAVADLRAGGVR